MGAPTGYKGPAERRRSLPSIRPCRLRRSAGRPRTRTPQCRWRSARPAARLTAARARRGNGALGRGRRAPRRRNAALHARDATALALFARRLVPASTCQSRARNHQRGRLTMPQTLPIGAALPSPSRASAAAPSAMTTRRGTPTQRPRGRRRAPGVSTARYEVLPRRPARGSRHPPLGANQVPIAAVELNLQRALDAKQVTIGVAKLRRRLRARRR